MGVDGYTVYSVERTSRRGTPHYISVSVAIPPVTSMPALSVSVASLPDDALTLSVSSRRISQHTPDETQRLKSPRLSSDTKFCAHLDFASITMLTEATVSTDPAPVVTEVVDFSLRRDLVGGQGTGREEDMGYVSSGFSELESEAKEGRRIPEDRSSSAPRLALENISTQEFFRRGNRGDNGLSNNNLGGENIFDTPGKSVTRGALACSLGGVSRSDV